MIIKKLKLKNFKTFDKLELTFENALIGIIGKNGSGKSSLFEAISFALYGDLRDFRVKKEQIKNSFTKSKDVLVELTFELDSKKYKIIRELKGKSLNHKADIYQDKEHLATGDREVSKRVEKLLKLNKTGFKNSVFASQKELSSLSNLTNEERRKTIRRLLNLEKIDKLEALAKEEIKKFESEVGFISKNLIPNRDELDSKLELLAQDVLKTKERIDKTSKEYESISREIDRLNLEIEALEIEREKEAKNRKEIELFTQKLELLTQNIKKEKRELKKLREQREKLGELEPKTVEIDNKIDKTSKEYESLSREIEKLNLEIEALEIEREKEAKNRKEIELLTQKLQTLNQTIEKEKKELQELKEQRVKLEELEPKLLEFEKIKEQLKEARELQNEKLKQDEIKKNRDRVDESIIKLEIELSNATAKLTEFTNIERDVQKNRNEIETLEQKKIKVEEKRESISNRRAVLKGELNRISNDIEKLEKLDKGAECPTCKQKLGDEYLTILKSFYKSKEFNEPLLSETQEKVESIEKEINLININIEDEREVEKSLLKDVNSCKNLTREIESINKNLDRFSKEREDLIANLKDEVDFDESILSSLEQREREYQEFYNEALKIEGEILKIDKKEREIIDLEAKEVEILKAIETLKTIKISFDETIYKDIKSKIKFSIDKKDEISELKSEYLKSLNSLKNEIENIQNELERADKKEREIIDLESKREQIERDIESLKAIKISFDESIYRDTKVKEKLLIEKKIETTEIKGKFSQNLNNLENEIKNIKNELERDDEKQREIEALELDKRDYQKIQNSLKSFKLVINNKITPLISQEASFLFNKMSDGKYEKIKVDSEFNFYIYDKNAFYPIDRFSGGEIDLANLTLRIAISKVLNSLNRATKISFLAFDEIFGSQDEKRRENILKSLYFLKSSYRQIFIISHIEDVKDELEVLIDIEDLKNKKK